MSAEFNNARPFVPQKATLEDLARVFLPVGGDFQTLVPLGTTRADAAAVISRNNTVAGDGTAGILLPTLSATLELRAVTVYNSGASNLKVYAASSGSNTINGTSGATAFVIAAKSTGLFFPSSTTNWSALTGPQTATFDDTALTGDATSENLTLSGNLQVNGNTAVTATTGGGTTGLIPADTSFCTVTSDSADKQISLPAATVGDRIRILVGATGCELISAVAAHKVNDVVVGATNEAALTATNLYDCQYVATNTWVVIGYTKLGAVQAALVPDSL